METVYKEGNKIWTEFYNKINLPSTQPCITKKGYLHLKCKRSKMTINTSEIDKWTELLTLKKKFSLNFSLLVYIKWYRNTYTKNRCFLSKQEDMSNSFFGQSETEKKHIEAYAWPYMVTLFWLVAWHCFPRNNLVI